MGPASYKLVRFDKVESTPTGFGSVVVWHGIGQGLVLETGTAKLMRGRMRFLGGNKAGYFVYLSDKPVGSTIHR